MRDLRLITVSDDGGSLILSTADDERFNLPIDDQLRAAVRGHRAHLGQLQIEMEPLTPRDIQARIRAGETAEELSTTAGVPLDRIQRYEGPVLAERRHIADAAQSAALRRGDGGLDEPDFVTDSAPAPRLGPFVTERLGAQGVDPAAVSWDAWRRDDGRWQVMTRYREGSRDLQASWIYDPEGRVVVADSDGARTLIGETVQVAARPKPRRLRSVPPSAGRGASPPEEADASAGVTEAAPSSAAEPEPQPSVSEPPAAAEDETPPAEPPSPQPPDDAAPGKEPRRRGKRPARPQVPSWDEIVFGAKKSE